MASIENTEKQATEKPKKATTTRGKTAKAKPQKEKIEQVEVSNNEANDIQLTPEMFALFQKFMEQQTQSNKTAELVEVAKAPRKKVTKTSLYSQKDREVAVRSMLDSPILFKSPKTQLTYRWTAKGDVEVLTVAEVLAMESSSKLFLHTPWLVVEDEEVVEGLGLQEAVNIEIVLSDIPSFLKKNNKEIKEVIENMERQTRNVFIQNVMVLIQNEELSDVHKIRMLEDILKVKFGL